MSDIENKENTENEENIENKETEETKETTTTTTTNIEESLASQIVIDPASKEKEKEEDKIESELDLGEKLLKLQPVTAVIAIVLMLLVADAKAFTAFIGTIIVIIGEGLRIYSKIYAGDNFNVDTEDFAGVVINDGPYKYIRHPMFLSHILVLSGMAFFSGNIFMMIVIPAWFLTQYFFISKYEESLLVLKNKDYENYIKEVPAWVCNYKDLKLDVPSFEESIVMLKSESKLILFIFVVLLLFCFR